MILSAAQVHSYLARIGSHRLRGWRLFVVMDGLNNGRLFGVRALNGVISMRRVLRFGQKITGEDLPSVPQRYRGIAGPSGHLVGARLRPATGEVWPRLRPAGLRQRFQHQVRTLPFNTTQPPAPTPDAIEILGDMRIYCHDGYVGRLEGIAVDPHAGVVLDLLVHVRSNVTADVESPTEPLARLAAVSGQHILLPATWAITTKPEEPTFPHRGRRLALRVDASAEQIACGVRLRRDGDIAADLWSMYGVSPALAPYTGRMRIEVHDGEVTLEGIVPSPRHRASAEQDAWHVPGVFAMRNRLEVER